MNEVLVKKCFILFYCGQTNVHDKDFECQSSVVTGKIKAKIDVKLQEDRHDCTHFDWNSWIQMSVVLLISETTSSCVFASNLVLSLSVIIQDRPSDSSSWMFVHSPLNMMHYFWTDPLSSSHYCKPRLSGCKWRWFKLFLPTSYLVGL